MSSQLPSPKKTIAESLRSYLMTIQDSRSANTAKAYRQALAEHELDVNAPASDLPEDGIAWLADASRPMPLPPSVCTSRR